MQSIPFIAWCLEHLNYWTITLLMTIESSFIPFPSEVVVPPAAYKSAVEGSMNPFLIVIFATIGADLGALINYALARFLGRPIIYRFAESRFGHMCLLNSDKVKQAEEYFDRHGAMGTLIGRLVPAVRQLISIPAGLSGMPMGKFLLYTTLGAGIWNSVLALLGWFIFKTFPVSSTREVADLAAKYSHEIGYVILGLAVFVVAFLIYKARK